MTRPFLINLNPMELKYYPFMISLDEYRGIYNAANDLSTKICAPSITKDANIQVFNMITIKIEAKRMVKHI